MEDGQHAELVKILDLINLATQDVLVQCQYVQSVWEGWQRAREAIVAGIEQIQPSQSRDSFWQRSTQAIGSN